MIPGIEEMLLSHARQNGLHRFDMGMMQVGERVTFIVTGWWDAIGNETPCSNGIAESVTAAFGEMIDRADKDRAEARASIQGEAFPQPQRRDGKEPCGECRLPAGETCDICGAASLIQGAAA